MKQNEIAVLFDQMADLLEYQGENVFRVRAYRRAAQNLESFAGDLEALAAGSRLAEIPGVGKDLAAKIEEYLATGRIQAVDKLKTQIPRGVLELIQVPGLGPKTAKRLTEQLKVDTLAGLEAAIRSGKLKTVPGFQEKKAQNLLKGIQLVRQGRERMPLGTALMLAKELVALLERVPGVSRVSTAGSLRRMRETIGDLDLLAASRNPSKVIDVFRRSATAARVLAAGPTKASILTKDGLQVDLRVVKPESFGAALQYFTGSKEHNVRLRDLAVRQGLKVNEYGVFRLKDNRRLAGREEEDVYKALGLPWMPPEIREDQGELEAAKSGTLPRLVELKDIRADFHVHTTASDGNHPLDAMAKAGEDHGYAFMVITDHSPSLKIARGLTVARLRQQIAKVRAWNRAGRRMRLLVGAEVDILTDGSMDYPDPVLAQLDFVIGSIHSGFAQSERQITQRMVRAMRNPYVNMIAHPSGRLIGQREPYALDYETAFKEAVATGTAMEINAYPRRLDLTAAAARRAHEAGVMLAIATDSHHKDHLDHMGIGVGLARRAWVEPRHLLNCFASAGQLAAWVGAKRRRTAKRV
jgi:DNA polymerase (family 10)